MLDRKVPYVGRVCRSSGSGCSRLLLGSKETRVDVTGEWWLKSRNFSKRGNRNRSSRDPVNSATSLCLSLFDKKDLPSSYSLLSCVTPSNFRTGNVSLSGPQLPNLTMTSLERCQDIGETRSQRSGHFTSIIPLTVKSR